MKTPSRLPDPELDELPRELADLGRKIAALSGPVKQDLETAYEQVVDAVRRRRKILSLVQEALSQLRLDIKYLMFDLEVTRRERDELRQERDSL
uniref:Transcriptional regulator n=1 Tax=Schlesneria paludicola TaxID=360056 RepID=A0A7C2JX36_9PLAN